MENDPTAPVEILRAEVVYCSPRETAVQSVRLSPGATVQDAIDRSRILERFPEIDLTKNKVGVYGSIAKLDKQIRQGDRVEIYRSITCDPETVPRRDVEEAGQKGE